MACALACGLACAWLVLWLVLCAWLVKIFPGLKKNRGTGTAPGPNSGALPCLFHWETQEYGPGAVALPLALCQTATVIIPPPQHES